ncbi:hypothetical protein [Shewanella sp.]|uniref:hypothetical protein n=1 Tax=Shewanella sp. TaxID=50422 RepID=UPI003A975856
MNKTAQQAANRRQDEKRRNQPAFPRTFLDAESAELRDKLLQIYGTNAEILREGMRLLAEKHQLK